MVTSWRNKMRQFFTRLRSPRYAIALLFGAAYFFFVFGGGALLDRSPPSAHRINERTAAVTIIVGAVVPLMLAIIVAAYWLVGGSTQAIALSPAEANFLVPAPITRRRLIQFKLLSTQPAMLSTAIIMTFMTRSLPIPWYLRFPSVWLLFNVLHLHQVGASLVHAGLQHQGRAAWRRVWPATLIFLAGFPVVILAIVRAVKGMRTAESGAQVITALDAVFGRPPVNIVLAPFNALIAPMRAASVSAWLTPAAIALAMLALHYVWVLSSDAAFEEGAVEAGAKRAAALEAMRKGDRPTLGQKKKGAIRQPWFRLPAAGVPAYAIWWKNVLQFTRSLSPFLVALLFLLPTALGAIDYADSHSITRSFVTAGTILLILGGFSILVAPMALRNDLRTDLRRIELLRTLPVQGTPLVAAEIAAASFSIVFIQLVAIGVGALLVVGFGDMKHLGIIVALVVPIALLIIAFNLVLLLIHNGFALLFPAWVRMRESAPGGIEVLGQNVMVMVGSVLLFVLSLIPPVLAAAATAGTMGLQIGKLAAVPAVAVFLAVLYLEIWGGLVWLGRAYDTIDPVDAGLCQ